MTEPNRRSLEGRGLAPRDNMEGELWRIMATMTPAQLADLRAKGEELLRRHQAKEGRA